MSMRTYFNYDIKRYAKPAQESDQVKGILKENKRTQIVEEKEKQLWEIDLKSWGRVPISEELPPQRSVMTKPGQKKVTFMPGCQFIKLVRDSDLSQKSDQKSTDLEQASQAPSANEKPPQAPKLSELQIIDEQIIQELQASGEKEAKNSQENEEQTQQDENANSQNQTTDKQAEPADKKINKKKIVFKKGMKGNYVKQDLKKIYKDRFRGALYKNQKYFKKNGKLKNPSRTQQEQKQIEFQLLNQMGQASSYNIYIQSISSALLTDIFEDEADVMVDDLLRYQDILKLSEAVLGDPSQENALALLRLAFQFENFREGQFEAIKSIIQRESMLLVQRTGHGKSLVYQYLALLYKRRVGIILTPLVSLMLDQIAKLPKWVSGIAYHSMLTSFQKEAIFKMVKNQQVRLIFCTPEIFQSDLGFQLNEMGDISFICVDEAHCVSELSHSFRYTYLVLDQMIASFLKDSQPPYLALTATATPDTVRSIMSRFAIKNSVISINTERQNLKITVSRDRDYNVALLKLLNSNTYRKLSSIIIYCRSRYMVDMVSNYLSNSDISCHGFHGFMDEQEKMDVQNKFIKNQIRIVVATSIFAMGIDKADVGAVIHLNMPKSMEAYLQEIGRAGRNGDPAYCHMFLRESDFHLERSFLLSDSPDKLALMKLYHVIQKWFNEEQIDRIHYLNSRAIEETLDIRKQSAYTLMQVLGKFSNQTLEVLPITCERLVLKFTSTKSVDARQKNEFLERLFQVGKSNRGELTVNVIRASNELQIHPLDIVRKCRAFFNEFGIKVDMAEEIFPFRLKAKISEDVLNEAFKYMDFVKQKSLDKLYIIYLTAFEMSKTSIEHVIKEKAENKQFFDTYFKAENAISTIMQEIYGSDELNVDEYLPFEALTQSAREDIKAILRRFINEECANMSLKDAQKKREFYLSNPNILSRLLSGVQTVKYSYKEFKNTSIWNKSRNFKYEEVHRVVLEFCLSEN